VDDPGDKCMLCAHCNHTAKKLQSPQRRPCNVAQAAGLPYRRPPVCLLRYVKTAV
jgi:hypothetical protein